MAGGAGKAEAFEQDDQHRYNNGPAADSEQSSCEATDQSTPGQGENQGAVLCEKICHARSPSPNAAAREALAELGDDIFDAGTRTAENGRDLCALFDGQPDSGNFEIDH